MGVIEDIKNKLEIVKNPEEGTDLKEKIQSRFANVTGENVKLILGWLQAGDPVREFESYKDSMTSEHKDNAQEFSQINFILEQMVNEIRTLRKKNSIHSREQSKTPLSSIPQTSNRRTVRFSGLSPDSADTADELDPNGLPALSSTSSNLNARYDSFSALEPFMYRHSDPRDSVIEVETGSHDEELTESASESSHDGRVEDEQLFVAGNVALPQAYMKSSEKKYTYLNLYPNVPRKHEGSWVHVCESRGFHTFF